VLLRLRLGAAGCSSVGVAATSVVAVAGVGVAGCSTSGATFCSLIRVALPSVAAAADMGTGGCSTAVGITCPLSSVEVTTSGAAAGFLGPLRLRLGAAGCSTFGATFCSLVRVALPSTVATADMGPAGCSTVVGVTCPLSSVMVADSGAATGLLGLLRLRLGAAVCSPSGDAAASVGVALPSGAADAGMRVAGCSTPGCAACPLLMVPAPLDDASEELAALAGLRRLRVRTGGWPSVGSSPAEEVIVLSVNYTCLVSVRLS